MKEQFGKYIRNLALTCIGLVILAAGFNWLVNPYDTYGSPLIPGFNAEKPEVRTHGRMTKAYAVHVLRPEAVILGTSRALWGLDPEHGGWKYHPVYNLAFEDANIYEILRYFQHTNHLHPLKQAVLNLDLFAFPYHNPNTPDFNEADFSIDYSGHAAGGAGWSIIKSIFSLDTMESSINTIKNQQDITGNLGNGMGSVAEMQRRIEEKSGHRQYFIDTTVEYITTHYLEEYRYDIDVPDSPFTYYRQILRLAYRDGIDLKLAISPCHARHWEIVAVSGLWDVFEDWKRVLVKINEEEAGLAGKKPFPFWDFGVYNEITTEPVPVLGDAQTPMRWYWDSSHYKKELGDLMLDRIFSYQDTAQSAADDFGVYLNTRNIEGHLGKIRTDRRHYRETHPEDIAEIEEISKQHYKQENNN